MFTITSIRILKDCQYRRILKKDTTYPIGHKVNKDFYAKNICISAIVGQNGAGKTSLIDMMFRIINNFSYCLCADIPRNAAEPLSYIMGIYADLNFMDKGVGGAIKIRDGYIGYEYGEMKCRFVVYHPDACNVDPSFIDYGEFEDYDDYSHCNFEQKRQIAQSFFYTIATNYSMQSFVAKDYVHEIAIHTQQDKQKKDVVLDSWLNNLFHKNDGYVCPIVLNPYRTDGWINMNTEEQLTVSRLSALLLEEKEEEPILDGYDFVDLESSCYPRTMPLKFKSIVDDKVAMFSEDDCKKEADLVEFEKYARNKNSFSHAILSELRCGVKKDMPKIQLYIRMYVVYKVLSIAEKYPYYSEYKQDFGNINYVFADVLPLQKEILLPKVRELTRRVKADPSHIGLKLRQALNFIRKGKYITDLDIPLTLTYDKYAELLKIPRKGMSIEKRMEWLPPGIFHTEIKVRKRGTNEIFPINHLSSGERQFIYQTSTLLYHAYNLKSIPNNATRIRYNKLNFVLDEVEICFHPEYQRTLVKRLVDLLVRLRLNKAFDINIILTTHSPFILSDMPKQNILYLEDGDVSPKTETIKKTFAANMGDILQQSFFLKNGFMGAVAQEKMRGLIEALKCKDGNSMMPLSQMMELIDMVGDDLIHQHLIERLGEYKRTHKIEKETLTYDERLIKIKRLEAEIAKLKEEDHAKD